MIPGLLVLGLLVGSAVGGTAALPVAPVRGSDLRRRVRARVQPAAARVRSTALRLTVRIRAPPAKGRATKGEGETGSVEELSRG
jgi:gas vesicle protein